MELKFFQEIGRDYLAKRTRALLADEMRLGKTCQAITACDKVNARRVLVVGPAISREHWRREFLRWSPGRSCVLAANKGPLDRMNALAVGAKADDVVLSVSYDQAREQTRHLTRRRWDVLILDEIHYAKNPTAGRTQAVLAKGGVAWCATRIWALSGTPCPNHFGEIWPTARAFGVVKTGYWDFQNYFCQLDWSGRPVGSRPDRFGEMRAILDKFMLRRLKKDVASELPPLSIEPWFIESSTKFLDVVKPVKPAREEFVDRAKKEERRLKERLDQLPPDKHAQHLEQFASSYTAMRKYHAILKAPAVYETVKFELENNLIDKVVIYGYHRDAMYVLFCALKDKFRTEMVYGGTSDSKRNRALDNFAKPTRLGGARVFIGNILAAGSVIDLSAAHQGIMLEKDYVPGNNMQAMERMGGYKQTEPITFRDATIEGPIDGMVNDILNRKTVQLESIFN